MGRISYQCQQGNKHLINQCQTNGHDQLSMSTQTQELNLSMSNQWARSAINVNTGTSTYSINAKPMGTISARMFQGGPNYSQLSNQSEVSIYQLTVFGFYIKDQGCNARKVISEEYKSFVLQCTVSGR